MQAQGWTAGTRHASKKGMMSVVDLGSTRTQNSGHVNFLFEVPLAMVSLHSTEYLSN